MNSDVFGGLTMRCWMLRFNMVYLLPCNVKSAYVAACAIRGNFASGLCFSESR